MELLGRLTWVVFRTVVVIAVLLVTVPFALPQASNRPPAGVGAARERLAKPPVLFDTGAYAFALAEDNGQPVRFDPCRKIHVVTNFAGAAAAATLRALLLEALAEVGTATGLVFVDDGPTTETFAEPRAAYQPDRYGRRWAPVLVTMANEAQSARLAGDTVGLAGPDARGLPGTPLVYVTGVVVFDAEQLPALLDRPGGQARTKAVMLHELGHLVGLDHVNDPDELMYPTATGRTTFGDGDRDGLARLGSGPCVPLL